MLTLRKLKEMIESPKKGAKKPTPKSLREGKAPVIAQKVIKSDTDLVTITVYKNGYVVYEAMSRVTVFPIEDISGYRYSSVVGSSYGCDLTESYFEEAEWYLRFVLRGEDRLSINLDSRNQKHCVSLTSVMEEMLALDRIEFVVDFFRHTSLSVTIDIETNASLITDEIAKKLFNWKIHIGISMDGTPELHNRQRRMVSGKPSAEVVERGIRNLQKYYGEDIGGIIVVTKHNYKYVKEILDYFIYTLHLTSMKFNLVRDNDHAPEQKLALDEKDVFWFANELMDYLQAYRCLGANFSEGNIEVRAKNLLQRSNMSCCISHGCQGGRKMVSFDHKGNIFPCEMIDFPEEKIGSIYEKDSIEIMVNKAAQQNKFFLPKKDERCKECPWWYYCQGGCSSRNRYLNRDGQIDEVECALNRSIYPRLIQEILNGNIS